MGKILEIEKCLHCFYNGFNLNYGLFCNHPELKVKYSEPQNRLIGVKIRDDCHLKDASYIKELEDRLRQIEEMTTSIYMEEGELFIDTLNRLKSKISKIARG